MGEGKVEEVREKVLDVTFRVVFQIGLIFLHVKLGGVNGFTASVAEEIKAEVEQAGKVCTILELVNIVTLYLVAGTGKVVEEKAPAVEVALEAQRHGAVERGVGKRVKGGCFQDEREKFVRQLCGPVVECGIERDLFLGGGHLDVQQAEGSLLDGPGSCHHERVELFNLQQVLNLFWRQLRE